MNFACEETGRPCAIGKPRRVALGLGLSRFFTGRPCVNGHIDWRLTTGTCMECARASDRKRRQKQKANSKNTPFEVRVQIVGRNSAKDLGLSRYFTGLPCARGHISERKVSNFDCLACSRLRRRGELEPILRSAKLPTPKIEVLVNETFVKTCPSCGEEFCTVVQDKVYCGTKCSNREKRRRSDRRNRILLKAAKQILNLGELPT